MPRCSNCGREAEHRNRLGVCARCMGTPVSDLGDPDDLARMTSRFDEPWPGHDDWLADRDATETLAPNT